MPITTIQFKVTIDIRHGNLSPSEVAELIDKSVREFMTVGHHFLIEPFRRDDGPVEVVHGEPTTISGGAK